MELFFASKPYGQRPPPFRLTMLLTHGPLGSQADINRSANVMSALLPRADMCGATRDVRFGPISDMLRTLSWFILMKQPATLEDVTG